jgi:hypothetical protein
MAGPLTQRQRGAGMPYGLLRRAAIVSAAAAVVAIVCKAWPL